MLTLTQNHLNFAFEFTTKRNVCEIRKIILTSDIRLRNDDYNCYLAGRPRKEETTNN